MGFPPCKRWVQPDAETKRTWLVMTQTLKPGPGLVRYFTAITNSLGGSLNLMLASIAHQEFSVAEIASGPKRCSRGGRGC